MTTAAPDTFDLDPLLFHSLQLMVGGTNDVRDRKRAAIVLSWARTAGCYPQVLAYVMAERRKWRRWVLLTQRDWQTKVSRRPQRSTHHDSWAIREKYVRCSR